MHDGRNWNGIGTIKISNTNQENYQFLHTDIPGGNLYYRIREIDIDGAYIYSNIALLHNKNTSGSISIFPNPANEYISISGSDNGTGKTQIYLYDAVGKKLASATMSGTTHQINTTTLPNGTYLLKIVNNGNVTTQKVLIMHR